MGLFKILNRLRCKMFACFGSKCSIEDTNNDGIPDKIIIEKCEKCEKNNLEGCDKECYII